MPHQNIVRIQRTIIGLVSGRITASAAFFETTARVLITVTRVLVTVGRLFNAKKKKNQNPSVHENERKMLAQDQVLTALTYEHGRLKDIRSLRVVARASLG